MAGPPSKAAKSRIELCALMALIGLHGSVGFGQMPPPGYPMGPDGRPVSAYGAGQTMPGPFPPAAQYPATPAQYQPAPAQSPAAVVARPDEMVVEVRIVGNRTITLDKITQKIRTRAGRAYSEEQVQQDVRELYKLGVFAAVRTLRQAVPGGVIVTFQLAERPLLQEVIIVGNDTYLTSSLKKEADLKVGDAADPFAVENGRRKIEEFYKNKGFSKVRVTVREGNKAGDLRAVIIVDEGPRQRILWVNFVGNTFVSSQRLKTIIQSHPPYFYLFSGEVDRKQIDEDVGRLTAYYRSFGFYFARVSRVLEFNEAQNWLTITFVIAEGPRYVVRNVSFLGNKKIDTSRLNAKVKLLGGQFYDQNQQNLDLQKLRDEYGGDGYVFAKVEADNRLLDQPGTMDIVYNVDEGSRYRVGRINIQIKGENPHTQITTVLNRLSFKPGDIVDTREIANSERRLKAAQLYKVEPQKGIEPKIVYSPPALEDKDTEIASQRRTTYYRVPGGEAPLPPGERYLDIDFGEEPQQSEAPPQYPRAAPQQPQPTFQGQTFQPATYSSEAFPAQPYPGQAYPAAPYAPQPTMSTGFPRGRFYYQSRYEAADGYPQTLPQQQEQSWQPTGPYGGQPLQGNPAPQLPPAGPMLYNPPPAQPYNGYPPVATPPYSGSPAPQGNYNPPAAPYGGSSAAPPSGYSSNSGYGPAPNNAAPGNPPFGYAPGGPSPERPVTPVTAGEPYTNPQPSIIPNPTGDPYVDLPRPLPISISPEETQTGRLMFGVGVNSDAGLVGNITVDEQNFDWRQYPTSWEDIMEGRAFRGAGERFRLELVPGTQVQRYSVTFSEPYLGDQPVSLGLNGFYYERLYPEWTETRVGGGISLGYQFTHDLTGSVKFLGQNVDIKNPEFPVPSLEDVLGHSPLFTTSVSLQHDTRDSPFMATSGHLISATIGETIGAFQYPQVALEWSQFFRIFERADRSGKQVLSLQVKAGYTGDNTPIFDRFYAGGFSSIRGFAFRGVTPRDPVYGMGVGGDFQMTATAQYMFPITADDMLKGVFFVDAGTVEPTITNWIDTVRVAPGFGLRISIPMMGPAPIALDFAFPISKESSDQQQIFSFFVGFNH
jgi:outer membrane protein insertion porin family